MELLITILRWLVSLAAIAAVGLTVAMSQIDYDVAEEGEFYPPSAIVVGVYGGLCALLALIGTIIAIGVIIASVAVSVLCKGRHPDNFVIAIIGTAVISVASPAVIHGGTIDGMSAIVTVAMEIVAVVAILCLSRFYEKQGELWETPYEDETLARNALTLPTAIAFAVLIAGAIPLVVLNVIS